MTRRRAAEQRRRDVNAAPLAARTNAARSETGPFGAGHVHYAVYDVSSNAPTFAENKVKLLHRLESIIKTLVTKEKICEKAGGVGRRYIMGGTSVKKIIDGLVKSGSLQVIPGTETTKIAALNGHTTDMWKRQYRITDRAKVSGNYIDSKDMGRLMSIRVHGGTNPKTRYGINFILLAWHDHRNAGASLPPMPEKNVARKYGFILGSIDGKTMKLYVVCGHQGMGRCVMMRAIKMARDRNLDTVTLDALPQVLGYYPRFGFGVVKDPSPDAKGAFKKSNIAKIRRDGLPFTKNLGNAEIMNYYNDRDTVPQRLHTKVSITS
jgi:hypothetical protein